MKCRDTAVPCPYGDIHSTYKPAICCKVVKDEHLISEHAIDLGKCSILQLYIRHICISEISTSQV